VWRRDGEIDIPEADLNGGTVSAFVHRQTAPAAAIKITAFVHRQTAPAAAIKITSALPSPSGLAHLGQGVDSEPL
jgi:hypothetical protein